jgi:hypothetical protein
MPGTGWMAAVDQYRANSDSPPASAEASERAAAPVTVPVAAEQAVEEACCAADAIVTALLRRTRYLLTLKRRPPLRMGGLETVTGLQEVTQFSATLLAHRHDERFASLAQGLKQALDQISTSLLDCRRVRASSTASSVCSTSAQHLPGAVRRLRCKCRALTQIAQQDCTPLLTCSIRTRRRACAD